MTKLRRFYATISQEIPSNYFGMTYLSAINGELKALHAPITCRDGFLSIISHSLLRSLVKYAEGYIISGMKKPFKFNLSRKARWPIAISVANPEVLALRITQSVNSLEDYLGFKRTLVEVVEDYHPQASQDSLNHKRVVIRVDSKWFRDQPTSSFYFMLLRVLSTTFPSGFTLDLSDKSPIQIIEYVAARVSTVPETKAAVITFISKWNEIHDMELDPIQAYLGFDYKKAKFTKPAGTDRVHVDNSAIVHTGLYGFGILTFSNFVGRNPVGYSINRVAGIDLLAKTISIHRTKVGG